MSKREKNGSLGGLLGRYGLDAPLSPEIRARMAGDYDLVYRKISEKTVRPALIAALAAWIFFLVKKAGIPVPLAKMTAAAAVTASVCAGAYLAMNAPMSPSPAQKIAQTVTIRPFVSRSLDAKAGVACAEALRQALDDTYGRGFSRLASGPGMGNSRWAVFGAVEKSAGSAVMIVKIVDARTSRTVFMTEEKCAAQGDCDSAAGRVVKKFAGWKGKTKSPR